MMNVPERQLFSAKLSLLFPRHSSTWSYVGWAGLYLCVGLYQWAGGSIPDFFAEVFYADFFINLASPFILGGGAAVVVYFGRKSAGVKWYELVILAIVFAITVVIPAAILFGVGGMPLLLGALLFFAKIGWFGVARERIKSIAWLIVRGLVGPFLFFAPSLVVATLVVGRTTLRLDETDWVAVFGIVYFLIQAVFEEFLLRMAEASDSSAD